MVKFSLLGRNRRKASAATTNLAGGQAFTQTPQLKLAQLLLTGFIDNKYYRSGSEELAELCTACAEAGPYFAAQAAVYARHVFGMRSASHVVAAQVSQLMLAQKAPQQQERAWLKDFYATVVRRPDDMREILALIMAGAEFAESGPGHSLPKALQKGFAKAFIRFDAYQLGAYRGEGAGINLVDVARLCHAKPEGPHAEALSLLMAGELRSEKQESKLTQAGQGVDDALDRADALREVWHAELPRMGYNALVLNARGIVTAAPELARALCARLEDAQAVRASLVLPLQLWKAYTALDETPGRAAKAVQQSLARAVDLACANLPQLAGKTLVALDTSGSMASGFPHRGAFTGQSALAIGSVFAAVLAKGLKADLLGFSDAANYLRLDCRKPALAIAEQIRSLAKVGGTNFHAIFEQAQPHYDRIFILSDMQGWVGYYAPLEAYKAYCERAQRRVRIYSFDLTGYGTSMFPQQDVVALSGLNFAVFDLIRQCEQDPQALVHTIAGVEFTQNWVARQRPKAGAEVR